MRGSITQRSKGSWSIRVDMGYVTVTDPKTGETIQKRKQKRITVRGTKRQAEEKLAEILEALRKNEFVEPSKMTFGEWLDEWFENIFTTNRPRTRETYEAELRNHIKPALGAIRLQQLKATDLQGYYNRLQLSEATKNRHHTIIHSALEAAAMLGHVTKNVAKLVPSKPRRNEAQQDAIEHCWTAEEARAFLAAAKEEGAQAYAFYTLALETGMRKGELAGLKWGDVDFEKRTITVARTLIKPGKEPVFGPPKNGSARTIIISEATARLLKKHRAEQNEQKMRNRAAYRDHGLVFAKRWEDVQRNADCLGDPLQINNIGQRQFARLIEKAGVKRIKFHGMRHTFATLALANGTPPHVVQRILGHKRIEITLGIYSHVLPDQQEAAAARMSAVLQG